MAATSSRHSAQYTARLLVCVTTPQGAKSGGAAGSSETPIIEPASLHSVGLMTQRLTVALLVAALCAGALAAAAAGAAPQRQADQPPVTFRVEVNYVEVDAFVTDAQGNLVTDLTPSDFEVLEDGKPQKVTAFSLVNIPIERAERPLFAGKPIEPDVQTNEHVEGRIYLIVLDDLHTDFTRTPRVKAAARRFIEQNFGTNDLAAVVFTGRGEDVAGLHQQPAPAAARPSTSSTAASCGRRRSSSIAERARQSRDRRSSSPGDDIDQMERAFRARSVHEHHPQAGRVHGRRARPAQGDAADRRRRRLQHLRGRSACWGPRRRRCCSTRRTPSPPRRAATSASTPSIRAA